MILEQIIAWKRKDVALQKKRFPLADMLKEPLGASAGNSFSRALESKDGSKYDSEGGGRGTVNLIAEVKKASPSKGIFCEDFDPARIALAYEENGAAAISVLTEERFFLGSPGHLRLIKEAVAIPVLRKEFIIDEYQLYETRLLGADAVLLIVAALSEKELAAYLALARELGLEALVETHDRREVVIALGAGARIIGINNRDLRTFHTDIKTTMELGRFVPEECLLVSESGICTAEDTKMLGRAGVDAVLVGEALLKSADPGAKVRELSRARSFFRKEAR